MSDLELIYLCAFRYALGRRTYIVEIVVDWLKNHHKDLSKTAKQLIIKEIESPLFSDWGHKCDKEKWMSFRDFLKQSLEKQ